MTKPTWFNSENIMEAVTWILFTAVTLIALAISWWSMFTLGTETFHMPTILAALVSLVFDLGAICLGLIAIRYATSSESNIIVTVSTYAFALSSAWINGMHAHVLNYGVLGIVVFASASIISCILLKVVLDYLSRKALKTLGRTVRKLPFAGKLVWILKPRQAWALLQLGLNDRLHNGWVSYVNTDETTAEQIKAAHDKRYLLENATTTTPAIESQSVATRSQYEITPDEELFTEVDMILTDANTPKPDVAVPEYLSGDMSTNKIARLLVENGITDNDLAFAYVNALSDNEVSLKTVQKSMSRAKLNARSADRLVD